MSDAARRKERQRLKREKKKAQMRRAAAGSPYKHIGRIGHIDACYINADWETGGMATIHLIRQNPQGGLALACFLIDLWCAGLKDAWGAIDMTSAETDRHVERTEERFELVRIEPEFARQLVAGGIRFARQNGFRLPAHYDRWVNVLGDLPETATADLRAFGKDGGLLWVGPMDDLRRRLIGCSSDEFLSRPGVNYITELEEFGEGELEEDEELDEIHQEFERDAETIVQEMLRLCAERGEEPSPLIREAVEAAMAATALKAAEHIEDPEIREMIHTFQATLKDISPPEFSEEMKAAVGQILRLMPNGPSLFDIALAPPESDS